MPNQCPERRQGSDRRFTAEHAEGAEPRIIAQTGEEQTAKDAMDAKGAKDTLGQHRAGRVIPSGSFCHPERQSFAALASFASLAVCSCR